MLSVEDQGRKVGLVQPTQHARTQSDLVLEMYCSAYGSGKREKETHSLARPPFQAIKAVVCEETAEGEGRGAPLSLPFSLSVLRAMAVHKQKKGAHSARPC